MSSNDGNKQSTLVKVAKIQMVLRLNTRLKEVGEIRNMNEIMRWKTRQVNKSNLTSGINKLRSMFLLESRVVPSRNPPTTLTEEGGWNWNEFLAAHMRLSMSGYRTVLGNKDTPSDNCK